MRISDIRSPDLFQRLVRILFVAERGEAYQVVDDSGGDSGLDGFDRQSGQLHAVYCPEKPESANFRSKFRSDLKKAVRLRDELHYAVRIFVFITHVPLREPDQRLLRDEALQVGFIDGINLADEYLEALLARHPELHVLFPELQYSKILEKLEKIDEGIKTLLGNRVDESGGRLQAAQDREPEESWAPELFWNVDTSSLEQVHAALESGDPDALFQLEAIRARSNDPTIIVAGNMLEMQHYLAKGDLGPAEIAAQRGLKARSKSRTNCGDAGGGIGIPISVRSPPCDQRR
jgi:hypothetical protein